MKVLITGGAGYIGSTIAACCQDNGITPVILDDYSKGLKEFSRPYANYEGDIADTCVVQNIQISIPSSTVRRKSSFLNLCPRHSTTMRTTSPSH